MKNKKTLLFIIPIAIVAIALAIVLPLMSINKINTKSKEFISDGYMLVANKKSGNLETLNTQYFFSSGSKYQKTVDNQITFTDVNGNKVTTDENNFLHYNDGSMNGLSSSVLLNTDDVSNAEQISYYSISEDTILQKSGNNYVVSNAGNNITLSNFVWKESDQLYMVVSDEVKLVVGEGVEQTFDDYVELQYNDEGIAHLVTQDGTYSTISSDAYLLLSNGVRIYIGSKNVSNEEEVLMNLSQMVVDSDDNIEVIPDEDYTIENEEQPQIIVNATDGEEGEAGEEGENGDNGENGAPGSQGTRGNKGTSDEKADVVYAPEKVPVFDNLKITPNAFGFDASMNYTSNDCDVAESHISVVNNETGQETWVYTLKSSDGSINLLAKNINISCSALDPSTQYTYVVYANWAPLVGDQHYNQSLAQQSFVTSSLGLNLTYYSATEESINLKVTKNMDTVITQIKVELFDNFKEQMNPNVFARAISTTIPGVAIDEIYDDVTKIIDVSRMQIGDEIEVKFENLTPNTIYYAKMLIQKNTTSTAIPDVFEKIKVMTLKRTPFIEAPTGEYLTQMNAFKISTGSIRDYDGGITSYRYEIYPSGADYGTDTPAYSLTKSLPTEINVDVSNNPLDPIHREKDYVARIIAIFNDNEKIVEVPSSFSSPFQSGQVAWPMASFDYTAEHITASTIEGTFIITDTNYAIQPGSIITIEASAATSTHTDYILVAQAKVNQDASTGTYSCAGVGGSTCTYNEAQKTYSIDIALQGLRKSTTYNFEISATTIKTATETGSHITSRAISTKSYDPIRLVEDIKERPNNAKFEIDVYFAALDPVAEAAKDVTKYNSALLDSLIDFSGKTMSYIRVEVYEANQVYDFPARYNPGNLIGFTDFYDKDIDSIKEEGVENKGNDYAHNVYDFSSSLYRQSYLNCKKYVQYLSDPEHHTLSECVVDSTTPLKITDMSFSEDIRKELTAGNNYMLKISVVNDYCYGDGSNYFNYVQMSRNGDVIKRDESVTYKVQNEIQVGTNMGSEIYGGYNQANPQDDQWILFSISDQLPAVPQVNDSLDIVYQNTVLQNILANSNAYNPDGYLNGHGEKELRLSNIYKSTLYKDAPGGTSEDIYQAFLNGYGSGSDARKGFIEANIDSVLNDTAVGVAYSGPRELAEYTAKTTPSSGSGYAQYTSVPYEDSSVLYTVYVKDAEGHDVKVTDSGWLTYLYHKDLNPKLPTYTFFFDLVDDTTGLSIGRGQEFYIRTQVRLKLDDTAQLDNEHNIIYPASLYTYYDISGAEPVAYYDVGGKRFETSNPLHSNQLFYNSTDIAEPGPETPTYKQKVMVTPEEGGGDPYEWHINKTAYAEKCIPEILSVMYDGSKAEKDTIYLSVFDPDDYLTKNAENQISLYYKDEAAVETGGYTAYTYGAGDYYVDDPNNKTLPTGITHRVKLTLDDADYLYYSYHIHRYDLSNAIIDEERYVNLLAQHGITDSMKVQFATDVSASNPVNFTIKGRIVSTLETPVSIVLENQTAYVAFVYQMMKGSSPMSFAEAQTFYRGTDGSSNNTPVVASNLVFKNYETDETTVKNTLTLNKDIVNTNLISQNGTHYFVAYCQVELPDIVDLIKTNASKIISCDVNLYFDNGNFGFHNQIGSGYYLLEYLNNGEGSAQTYRGFGLNPTGNISGYPDTVYVKNTSDPSRTNYYLFNKTNGTVKFDTKEKKMFIGSKSYYYDKYGIMYDSDKLAIAKGVSVVSKQGRTDQITNVFTIPYLDIDSGYSMFLINMTMSSNHTLITLETSADLPEGKTPADYPLTIEYSLDPNDLRNDDEGDNPRRSKVALEIHSDTTNWDNIEIKDYIDYSDPSNPVIRDLENNTTVYYNVYGWYMNNGVPTKIHLINKEDGSTPYMKTITSYVHDHDGDKTTLMHNWRAMEGFYKTPARDSKTIDYKFTITNRTGAKYTPSVIKEDITNSIKYVTFYLLKHGETHNVDLNYKKVTDTGINLNTDVVTTQWNDETGNLEMPLTGIIAAKSVKLEDVIATKTIGTETFGFIPNSDSDRVGYVYFYNEFNFGPGTNHVWDDQYAVIVEFVYKHGKDTLGDESNLPHYKQFISNASIKNIANNYVSNRMTITAEPVYNTDDQFSLDFTVSGNDFYRVAATYADHFAYIAELRDAVTNEVVNIPIYDADHELVSNNYQRKYIETTFSANKYTYLTQNFRFSHLEPNHQYYANIYFVADQHNKGIENYYSYISGNMSSGDVLKALQTEADPEVLKDLKASPTVNLKLSDCLVADSERLFTKKSDIFRTSLTSDTVVQACYFNSITENGAYFLTFGVNLNNIMRIEYDYRIGEDDLVTGQSVVFDPIHHTGDFVESTDGVYSLKLEQVNDPSTTYSTIVIRFYAGTTPGEGSLVSTIIKENIH